MKITLDKQFFEELLPDGTPNPFWSRLTETRLKGIDYVDNTDTASLTIPKYREVLVQDVIDILSFGGNVELYPVFIKVSDPSLEVPSFLSNSTKVVDEVDVAKTWNDFDPNQIDLFYYIADSSINGQVGLTGSEIKQLNDLGISLLSYDDYKALLPVEVI